MRIVFVLLLFGSVAFGETDPKTVRLWKTKCGSCHGADGKAQTEQAKKQAVADLTTPEWQKRFTDAQLKAVTEDGLHRTTKDGVKQDMDGYKGKLAPDQIDALVAYMRALAH